MDLCCLLRPFWQSLKFKNIYCTQIDIKMCILTFISKPISKYNDACIKYLNTICSMVLQFVLT